MKKISFLFFLLLLLFLPLQLPANETLDFSSFRKIPIQDQGRVKPFDTFAWESVQTITGSRSFEGKDPVETLLIWLASPEETRKLPIILTQHKLLNQKIGLHIDQKRVSIETLVQSAELRNFLQNLFLKQQQGESLDTTEKEAIQLSKRMELLNRILSGNAISIFPQTEERWIGLDEIQTSHPSFQAFRKSVEAFSKKEGTAFKNSAEELQNELKKQATFSYPGHSNINIEINYNHFRPFQKAWILFLLTFVVSLFAHKKASRFFYKLAITAGIVGVSISVYGFILRIIISGHPPVTNMYESVIWVCFGSMFFALIFEAIYRSRYFILAASAVSTIGLLLADNLPNILNPEIDPLVPVLRSNFWLTIHVLTITLSYAAFMLGMGVGQVALGYYAFKADAKETIRSLNLFLYRAVQVGVVLLAAGTILGGVWAAYSWGRFWGWDPKEVWALIALLGYLAILHGRFSGWLRDFGMAAWTVLAFLLVLMAWYGVNFILGVGLHSYGFSSGGFKGVTIFVTVQLAWVLFATVKWKRKKI